MEPVDRANPWSRDVPALAVRWELRATLALAAPLAAANLAQMAMAVTNTVMVGRLGAMPLAAAGLGGMLYFTGGVMLQGVLSAVAPLAAHAPVPAIAVRRVGWPAPDCCWRRCWRCRLSRC